MINSPPFFLGIYALCTEQTSPIGVRIRVSAAWNTNAFAMSPERYGNFGYGITVVLLLVLYSLAQVTGYSGLIPPDEGKRESISILYSIFNENIESSS